MSMPSVGRSSFLHRHETLHSAGEQRVSMPSVGRSSFLLKIWNSSKKMDLHVSMPSVGRSSFLQSMVITSSAIKQVCQCPQSGDPHFYTGSKLWITRTPESVNALSRASLISTRRQGYHKEGKVSCQCPQSGKPHFYPAPLEPAILAASKAHFCTYFSEYSDN